LVNLRSSLSLVRLEKFLRRRRASVGLQFQMQLSESEASSDGGAKRGWCRGWRRRGLVRLRSRDQQIQGGQARRSWRRGVPSGRARDPNHVTECQAAGDSKDRRESVGIVDQRDQMTATPNKTAEALYTQENRNGGGHDSRRSIIDAQGFVISAKAGIRPTPGRYRRGGLAAGRSRWLMIWLRDLTSPASAFEGRSTNR